MTIYPVPKDAPLASQKGRRLTSYAWAELGSLFRSARLAGNESLAVRIKQAIALKKEIRKMRKNGLAFATERPQQ